MTALIFKTLLMLIFGQKDCSINNLRAVRKKVVLLSLLMFIPISALTQDYSGIWCLRNFKNDDVYYLVPAADSKRNDGKDVYFDAYAASPTTPFSQPFLTTYKTNGDQNSVWEITAVTGESGYYHIKHCLSGKYVVYGSPLSNYPETNFVHLEESPDLNADNTKFLIDVYNSSYVGIRPKSASTLYWNVTVNNSDNYYGTSNGNRYRAGLIGGYNATADPGSQWTLESPLTISFTAGGKVDISSPLTSVSVYYTTDGTEPGVSNGTIYDGTAFTPAADATCIKAIAIKDGVSTKVAVMPVLTGADRTYLIKNMGYQSTAQDGFFLQPGDVNDGNTPLTTSSVARPVMQWRFVDAGRENSYQYFYLVNYATGEYLYCNSSGKVYMKPSSEFDGSSNDYKFRILMDNADGYRIVPKARQSYWLNKTDGNNSNKAVGTHNNATNLDCRWTIIPVPNHRMPDSERPTLFTVSSMANTYYKIGNVGDATRFIIPGTTYTTTSNTASDDMNWYFVSAGSDDWLDYYYIVNGISGNYLYFCGNVTSTGNNDAFDVRSYTSGDADRYAFVVAKTATGSQYYIVPKVLKDLTYTNYALVRRDGGNNLKTEAQRDNNDRKWTFTESTTFVAAPLVTVSNDNSSVTLSSPQDGVTQFYYTIGAYNDITSTEPGNPTTGSTSNTGESIPLTAGNRNVIKVIAAKTVSGTTYTSVVLKKVIDLRSDETADYSGYYYLQNQGNTAYNMYPSANSENSTVKTQQSQSLDAVWQIVKQPGTGAHNIIHYSTGRYLTTDNAASLTNTVKLTTLGVGYSAADARYLFVIEENVTDVYNIKPILAANAEDKNCLNPTNGNGNNHTLGLWTADDNGSKWKMTSNIPAAPTFSVTDNVVTITPSFGDVWYKVDNTDYGGDDAADPAVNDGTQGTGVTLQYGPAYTVKAVSAYRYNGTSYWTSNVATQSVHVAVASPIISVFENRVSITSTQSGVAFKYTTDESDPSSGSDYSTPFSLAAGQNYIIKAKAYNTVDGVTYWSDISTLNISTAAPETINTLSDITDANGNYILSEGFTAIGTPQTQGGVEIGTESNPFMGTIDGQFIPFELNGQALIDVAQDAIIKNIVISNATVSGSGNVGAIVNTARGATRIYNCGVLDGTVSGGTYVGGLVGFLDGSARVINCYNYANITSGTNCGGIVGYNNVASTSGNLQTMVMNCMFYGNITGSNPAPIYGGQLIHNKRTADNNTGLNNYCYFLYDEENCPYVKSIADANYQGALGAEERFLNRFEFFRLTLNSTRDMAAFYITGNATHKNELAKWVLDKSVAPYPILKAPGYYPSVVNPDAEHATAKTERNKGGLLGTLTVNIQMGTNSPYAAPTGAAITTASLTLKITDKDYDNYNFNYRKVQLPYYSQVGTGNYTDGRVVTGWKITAISGGTAGTFVNSGTDAPAFNFVDRQCTDKDLYSQSGRVFNQGAYWEVPDGVTAITIEPYWAKAVYLSDANYDVTYNGGTKYSVTVGGTCPTSVNGQTVYTSFSTAMNNLGSNASHTVYDYAVVLVGNYHKSDNNAIVNDGSNKPVTIMSADLDGDREPDNTLFYYHNARQNISPVRFDFINIPGVGMVKRRYDDNASLQPGIFKPKGWFEVTNTVTLRCSEFEYVDAANGAVSAKTLVAPLILQGGIYEQFVSAQYGNAPSTTNYILIGGNAWFKNFANGCHTNVFRKTPKCPINVAGGDFTNFYLTGIYQPNGDEDNGNAVCYIDGGRFAEVAGAGMQQLKGDVTWMVNAADIGSFYGGGINAAKPLTGSISTTITDSYVDYFYGGPKFGDMATGKTVTTNATGCHFGEFYGAGYGGTSLNRVNPGIDVSSSNDSPDWDNWVTQYYKKEYNSGNGGISTSYDYEFLFHADGSQTVARFFVNWASLSLASTRNVTTTLTGCTMDKFYGGGRLGAVNGDATSTLTDCTVTGNVYGAGYSAAVPTVDVWSIEAMNPAPTYNRKAGVFNNANVEFPAAVKYTWSNAGGLSTSNPFDDTNHLIYTDVDLSGLGAVTGNVTLYLNGSTAIDGSVFGGGEQSDVNGNTNVNIESGSVSTDVYGGGMQGDITGNVTVNIGKEGTTTTPTIGCDVYGGGALANTNTSNVTEGYGTDNETIPSTTTNRTTVNLKGGVITGDAYGGGLGSADIDGGVEAKVYGDVSVYQSGTILVPAYTADSIATSGRIFGCNNVNGTPLGHVLVYIENTVKASDSDKFAVSAVYGGGNKAEYVPYRTDQEDSDYTEVIVDGCDIVSIHSIYGGGNAASTPATKVTISGAKEIMYVFGGGNGAGAGNPGANVGYHYYSEDEFGGTTPEAIARRRDAQNDLAYGSGIASTNIYGGNIHNVFGGSNTRGNIRQASVTMLDELSTCPLVLNGIHGGGREAYMEGKTILEMGCTTGIPAIYGGSENADVGSDITLTLTSGHFDKVFGGNNKGGRILGSITVNIEQTGCLPITIDELYLGGNNAPYSVFGYEDTYQDIVLNGETIRQYDLIDSADVKLYKDPELHLRSFASIGKVFGGGNGEHAIMVGDPTVEINVTKGWINGQYIGTLQEYSQYKGTPQELSRDGVIDTVFGGGNEAIVIGNTNIFIGTRLSDTITIKSMDQLYNTIPETGQIRSNIKMVKADDNDVKTITYTVVDQNGDPVAGKQPLTVHVRETVNGASVTGNVYGGGNNADVTQSTNVQVGPNQ